MKKYKNNKGITLVTLTIAVVVLIIITSISFSNTNNGIKMQALRNLQNDIELLSNEVSSYFIKYGDIPAEIEYTGTIEFKKQPNDNEEYYVIDLSVFDNITLNYGFDFEKIKSSEDTKIYKDIYIINKQSLHIYYIKGILFNDTMYYTTENDDEITLH